MQEDAITLILRVGGYWFALIENEARPMSHQKHAEFMTQALQLAAQGRYTVSPNPMVGCLIIKDGNIIGQGYHQRAGESHAEVFALKEAGVNAQGATAYVTLEPCCHTGKTPPCTNALIAAGIKKVFIATLDPNPLINGKGVAALQNAGIEVITGLLEKEAQQLNEIFFHYIQHKRPFVIAKWAMSLDGKTVTHADDSRYISDSESEQTTHELRQQVDAILIGANTAIKDDPLLTVRLKETVKHPIRIILSTKGNLPKSLNIFSEHLPSKTVIATTEKNMDWPTHIDVIVVPKNNEGRIDLMSLMNELGKRQITSLLVEGGMTIHESFFAESLVNKVQVYVAPIIIGNLKKKISLQEMQYTSKSKDLHVTAHYEGSNHV